MRSKTLRRYVVHPCEHYSTTVSERHHILSIFSIIMFCFSPSVLICILRAYRHRTSYSNLGRDGSSLAPSKCSRNAPLRHTHAPILPSLLPTMSQAHTTAALASKFQPILNDPLKAYQRRTKKGLLAHPLSAQLWDRDSPSAVLAFLQAPAASTSALSVREYH